MGSDTRSLNQIQDASIVAAQSTTEMSTRIGFCLGPTRGTHGPRGDKMWAAEAVRLRRESVVVKVRPTG